MKINYLSSEFALFFMVLGAIQVFSIIMAVIVTFWIFVNGLTALYAGVYIFAGSYFFALRFYASYAEKKRDLQLAEIIKNETL